jgi:hypothetical protein
MCYFRDWQIWCRPAGSKNNIKMLCELSAIIFVLSAVFRCFSGPTFPRDWRGRYFQNGLGEVFIRDNAITTKGRLIDKSRDYYLFDNR